MAKELIQTFEKQLMDQRERWQGVLPPNVDATRFKSSVMTSVMRAPDLLTADRSSLIMACIQSANAGILPDGREGAITIFKDWKTKKKMAQWMPMVSGIVRRLRELGDLTSISAYCVYKTDKFSIELGDDPKIIHQIDPAGSRDPDDIIGAYAIFKNGDEVVHREFMTREEIDQTRGVSRTKDGGAWKSWYGEMARKTVIRRGSKSVPLSAAGAAIIEADDQWVDFTIQDHAQDHAADQTNPLEDDGHQDAASEDVKVLEVDTESVQEEVSVAPQERDLEAKLLARIETFRDAAELEKFGDQNKAKLEGLPVPLKGRVRSAFREKLKELRAA